MLKIGVIGAGHLGKIHIKCISMIPELELAGFFDVDAGTRQKVSEEYNLPAFEDLDELLDVCDIVDIVTPTPTHHMIAVKAMEKGKHVFLEKPVTETVEQAKELIRLQKTHGVKVQIGHVERFNPAYMAMKELKMNPMFIEGHRLSTFNPRGTDVSVILDLMIHDLDLVLQMIKSPVKEIKASGINIVSPSEDICNVRLEFENGAVANLTASRISLKQMRKIRIFQNDAYVSLDLLEKEAQIISLSPESDPEANTEFSVDSHEGKKFIKVYKPEVEPNNAIKTELQSFHDAIVNNEEAPVTLEQGYSALDLAHRIMELCRKR